MQIHQAIEIIFTILLILFLIVMVIAIMTFISILESLNDFDAWVEALRKLVLKQLG
jgi:CDP-diacylglycerol pyrophosphatase